MSDLLNQASLVMVPSGYKEDTVYSVVPSDGSGDLSFTRASNGTRVNSAGLVEVVPWNLLEQSNAFSTSPWTLTRATLTSGQSGYDNTSNAWKYTEGTFTASLPVLEQSFTSSSEVESYNFYLKAGTRNWVAISVQGTGYIWINLTDGTVGSAGGGTPPTATTQLVGNGWYLVSVSSTGTKFGINLHITDANNSTSYNGNGTGFVYVQNAQRNIGSTAKPYFPTTDRLNVPRLTYQNGGGGCPSLLLEKQSTNFQTYSQDFTNVAWTKLGQGVGDTAVVTANYAISPDGTQNATRFVCNLNGGTTSSDRSWMIASFTAQATSTISIWIKLNSAGTKTVLLSDSGGGTKTISGTDWQRIDATFVGGGGEFRIGLIGGSTSDTLDCCIWGAQAESGSYPTSYIPTTSASATRVADACSKTGISSLIGQTQGTLFIDVTEEAKNDGRYIFVSDASFANRIVIYQNSGSINVYCSAGSSFNIGYSPPAGRLKIAFVYKSNDYALWVNGVEQTTVTTVSAVPTGLNSTGISSSEGNIGTAEPLDTSVNQAILFPTRLTNAELASLTTI
jgi:hypothetical protein